MRIVVMARKHILFRSPISFGDTTSTLDPRLTHIAILLLLSVCLPAMFGCGGAGVANNSASNAATNQSSVNAGGGTGPAAVSALTASAAGLTFFETGLGSSSTLALSLTNTGNAKATILGVSVSGAMFVANGVSQGTILAAGQTATLNVTFTPQSRGIATASLTISSDGTNVPMVIPLAGPGYQQSSHSVTLSWAASTSNVSGYNVRRSTGPNGAFELLNAASITGTSYTDATVESGQTYYYNVTSVGTDGTEGAPSAQISISIPNS